jgi:hypothetical protein
MKRLLLLTVNWALAEMDNEANAKKKKNFRMSNFDYLIDERRFALN